MTDRPSDDGATTSREVPSEPSEPVGTTAEEEQARGRAAASSDAPVPADARDAAAAAKVGSGPVGTDASDTPQTAVEAAHEAGAQNVPADPGLRRRIEVVDVRTGMFGAGQGADTSGYGGLVRTIALPGPSERPYGGYFDEVVDVLTEVLDEDGPGFDAAIEKVVVDRGELTLFVARDHLETVCRALRDDPDLRFELGLGVSGVHWPNDEGRELHAVYQLVSVTHSRNLRLEVAVPEADPRIPSSTRVYPGHDWHERETFDFFGIVFEGHPGLARIQMPDDWPGHPQRKDYPLGGIPVEYKGAHIPPPDTRRSYS